MAEKETITRVALGGGRYRYESDARGTIIASSKVLYTHTSSYFVNDVVVGPSYPLLFHKTEAAAAKARGYATHGWVKRGVAEIGEGGG